jgi:hypothetical protein
MLIGTSAANSPGISSPRARKSARSAPAETARTTSLTVAPVLLSEATRFRSARADLGVEERRAHRVAVAGEVEEALRGPERGLRRRLRRRRVERAPRRLAGEPEQPPARVLEPAGDEPAGAAPPRRPLAAAEPEVGAVGIGVEDDRADVDGGDSVDEGVVGLRDRREPALAPLAAALDQVELPERPVLVQRLGHHLADEVPELRVAPRGGNGDVADVAADVEARVVLPLGPHHLPRQVADVAPEPGDQLEPLGDVGDEAIEVGRLALEQRRAADVDVDRPALGEQRCHVRGRELVRAFRGHRAATLSRRR